MGDDFCFPTLTKLSKAVVIVLHGNADTERVLGHVGLKHRNLLLLETLNSLFTIHFNKKSSCYEFKPCSDPVKKCKNAQASLKSQSQSKWYNVHDNNMFELSKFQYTLLVIIII